MLIRSSIYVCLLAGLLIGGASFSVYAQDDQNDQNDQEQRFTEAFLEAAERNAVPDIDSFPIQYKGLEIDARLGVEAQIVDNIFAVDENESADLVTVLEPSLSIRKEYRDHEFNFNAASGIFRHIDNTSEDIENYTASISGFFTALRSLTIPFEFSYALDHQQRNEERTVLNSQEPTERRTFRGALGFQYSANRLSVGVNGRYQSRRFDNGIDANGGIVVREDADFESIELETRVAYDAAKDWAPFLSLTIGRSDFQSGIFDGFGFDGPTRDNEFVTALTGISFDYNGLILGELGVGYTTQDFIEDGVDTISAFAVEGNIEWELLERATLELGLRRSIEEDNLLNNAIVESEATLGLNYELDRDLLATALLRIQDDEFEESDRNDTTYTGQLGLLYIINPRFQLDTSYTFRSRTSDFQGADFMQNIFRIGVNGRL